MDEIAGSLSLGKLIRGECYAISLVVETFETFEY